MIRQAISAYRAALRHYAAMTHFDLVQEGVVYSCALDDSKRRNLARQAINKRFLRWVELAKPHILHVGVTTHCNLSCPACPTGVGALWRSRTHLDYSTFQAAIDGFRDSLLFVLLWDWGEPLLHPKIAEMTGYLSRHNIKSVMSTNGNVPLSDARMESLLQSGLTNLIVCVDGADQQSYQDYRRGGSLQRALETVSRAASIKQRGGLEFPLIEFRSLATASNSGDFSRILALAESTGADLFTVKNLRPYDYAGHDLDAQLVPGNSALSRYRYFGDSGPSSGLRVLEAGEFNCGKPFYAPALTADGDLAFCHYVRLPEEFFGRIRSAGTGAVWRSRESRRRRLNFGRLEGTPSCRDCYFRVRHKPTVMCAVPLRELPPEVRLERPFSRAEFLEFLLTPGAG